MLESNNYKIVDNFLDKKNYQNVKDFITSQTLDWYFRETDTGDTRVTQNLNGFFIMTIDQTILLLLIL